MDSEKGSFLGGRGGGGERRYSGVGGIDTWMAPVAMVPAGVGMPRLRPLTTPDVKILERP